MTISFSFFNILKGNVLDAAKMNTDDVEKIIKTLKHFELIDPNRVIIGNTNAYCNFWAKKLPLSIQYDPQLLDFLNEGEFLWVLLHEESHFTHEQEGKERQSFKLKIDIFLAFIFTVLTLFLLPKNLLPIFSYYYLASLIVGFVIIVAIISYVDKHFFYQPYYKDEFEADKYALNGFFIIKPDLVPWQVMYSSFRGLSKCRAIKKKPSFLFRRFLKFSYTPHPTDNIRVRNVRALYNKYRIFRRLDTQL